MSDGMHPPEYVLQGALNARLEIFSITDHDTTGAYAFIKEDSFPHGVRLVKGVEFSTSLDAREIHLLGYFPGGFPETLKPFLAEMRSSRETRIHQGLRDLRAAGLNVAIEDVLEFKTGDILSRSHVARAMIKQKAAHSISEAFARYLGTEVGIFPPSRFTPYKVLDYLKSENAVAVWAHPEIKDFDKLIKDMSGKGLAGVEICSKLDDPAVMQYYERVASDFNMCVSFGSDWHGHGNEAVKGVEVEHRRVEKFLARFGL
jgi:hypothetical protein